MSVGSVLDLEDLWRDPQIRAVGDAALSGGMGPLYLVGGYLRDHLLGRGGSPRKDIDLVIWGELEGFGRAVASALDGTLVRLDPETVRAIARHNGAIVQIDISRTKGATVEADLIVRDFTVNAMAVRIDCPPDTGGGIIDPTGGLNDLRRRSIRAITSSAFDHDPLRLIRAVRLAGELGFTVEEATQQAIIERAPLLATVAGERLRDELFRIIQTVPAVPCIEQLDTLRLLEVLAPEVEALKSVPASPPHRLPLWAHSLETLRSIELLLANLEHVFPDDASWLRGRLDREIEAGVTEAAVLKLLGLLHDLGKPETRTVQPDGRVRFLGHEEAGLPILARLCTRLRLGRQATGLVDQLERHHLRPLLLSREVTVSARASYRFFRELGNSAPAVLLHSWADVRATVGEEAEGLSRHQIFLREQFRFYRTEFLASQMTPFVRGDDLIQVFGMPAGPFLGLVLDRLRELQATGLIRSREEGVEYVRKHLEFWRRTFEDRPSSHGIPGLKND